MLDMSKCFETHPVLETERLRLRPITIADAEDVFAYGSDPEVSKYMIFDTHRTVDDAIAWLKTVPDSFAKQEVLSFAITLRDSGRFIGSCGLHHISPNHHRLEIGYVLARPFWGHGYMTETVRELIRFAFEDMEMHRVQATCDLENERSARVMERCGMTHEATLRDFECRRGRFISVKMYGIVNALG